MNPVIERDAYREFLLGHSVPQNTTPFSDSALVLTQGDCYDRGQIDNPKNSTDVIIWGAFKFNKPVTRIAMSLANAVYPPGGCPNNRVSISFSNDGMKWCNGIIVKLDLLKRETLSGITLTMVNFWSGEWDICSPYVKIILGMENTGTTPPTPFSLSFFNAARRDADWNGTSELLTLVGFL